MLAFSHNISINQIASANNTSLPNLFVIKDTHVPITYKNVIKFDQNQGRDVFLSTNKDFQINRPTQQWMFKIEDVVSFIWEADSNLIKYQLHNKGTEQLFEYWLLHTLLPIYLTIEGKYELIHAGGVQINEQPVLFIAPSFGGKSTLTDYFIKKGHPMISDDRIPLKEQNNSIITSSSYPYHRPYRKMEDLGIKVNKIMEKDRELHCIYVLQECKATASITFTLLKGMEKFKALQYNFDFHLPLNKASSFKLIGKIAALIPIYKISIPWDLNRLEEVYQEICRHSKSIEQEKQ